MTNTRIKIFTNKTENTLEREINSYARKKRLEIISVSLSHANEYYTAAVVFKKIQLVDC